MNNCSKYIFRSLTNIVLLLSVISCSTELDNTFSEIVKVSLREVGHKLLLIDEDSTSLVNPVIALDKLKYQLSFEEQLSIHPDSLVALIKNSFLKADLPPYYLVEVLQCEDKEVAYSYEMKENVEKGIIPCSGRQLKKGCFILNIRFTREPDLYRNKSRFIYSLVFGLIGILGIIFYTRKRKKPSEVVDENYSFIGRFRFYPEQNKLIKEATEIGLSKIECELLAIFVADPNKIIKRDELVKRVWEDKGVVVGRSLDTYISKLRKKLQDDESIKLTNIHGVGYKLEINH